MKKIILFLLSAMFVFGAFTSLADEGFEPIVSVFLMSFTADQTAKDTVNDPVKSAMATIGAGLDLVNLNADKYTADLSELIVNHPTYIGVADNFLIVYLFDNDNIYSVMYDVDKKEASCLRTSRAMSTADPAVVIENLMKNNGYAYRQNELNDMNQVLQSMSKAMNK